MRRAALINVLVATYDLPITKKNGFKNKLPRKIRRREST